MKAIAIFSGKGGVGKSTVAALFAKEWDGKEVECNYQNRYESKKEAIADHERMMKALRDGKFTVSVTKVELEVDA